MVTNIEVEDIGNGRRRDLKLRYNYGRILLERRPASTGSKKLSRNWQNTRAPTVLWAYFPEESSDLNRSKWQTHMRPRLSEPFVPEESEGVHHDVDHWRLRSGGRSVSGLLVLTSFNKPSCMRPRLSQRVTGDWRLASRNGRSIAIHSKTSLTVPAILSSIGCVTLEAQNFSPRLQARRKRN